MSNFNYDEMVRYIPSSRQNLSRLKYLQENAGEARIAVFGKYNHGKSTLLNALVEKDIFSAADKRETRVNQEYRHDGIVWIDTPGLDADVQGKDDREARSGAFEIADFLFLVHNVKAGELDKYEQSLYRDLMKQDKNYRTKMFLVLTQIDQLEPADLVNVINKIRQQMPDLTIIPVSAVRYLKGIREGKDKFVAISGMDDLLTQKRALKEQVVSFRKKEIKRLINKARVELKDRLNSQKKALASLEYKQKKQTTDFAKDVNIMLSNIAAQA